MVALLLSTLLFANPTPRWLQLCDKGIGAGNAGTLEWEDAPVREDLLDSLRRRGWIVRHVYKWENKVSAIAPDDASLPLCVVDAGPVAIRIPDPRKPLARGARIAGVDEYTIALKSIWDTMGIELVRGWLKEHRAQEPGQGVTVAIIDGRFIRNHYAFAGMSIQDTFDFVLNHSDPWDRTDADWPDVHGTSVASLLGSSWEGIPGIVPKAKFLLYRAEDSESESSQEEDNLAAALVRAVEHGAQVISVSLGYRYADDLNSKSLHDWSLYDGRTLVASRAANAAARKGAIVVVAAGNEGTQGARSIGSPADADSVIAVGALDKNLALCGSNWRPSWGPTADGRSKPELSAFGCPVPVASGPTIASRSTSTGTSVATPLVAGLAALARQSLASSMSSSDLREKIIQSGHLWPRVDSQLGSGLPDLRRIEEIKSLVVPSSHPSTTARPQLVWSNGALKFTASSALLGSRLGVEVADATGRLIFHRDQPWSGEILWKPSAPSRPRILLARWWGGYGKGSSLLMMAP